MIKLSIYNMESKKSVFESNEVKEYEITNYKDITEFNITTCDNVDIQITLRDDNKYAISIMNLTGGDKNE